MPERLNLQVDDNIPELLTTLAGGERKRGQWLSDLIRGMAQTTGQPAVDVDTVLYALKGLSGTVTTLQGRVATLEARLSQWTGD